MSFSLFEKSKDNKITPNNIIREPIFEKTTNPLLKINIQKYNQKLELSEI